MPQAMRGLRWRLATAVVGGITVLLWLGSGINAPVLQVDWSAVPDLAGAEVVVDGDVVGRLELRRRRPLTGFKVPKGPHQVVVRWSQCPGLPDTITAISGRPARLWTDLEDRMEDGQVRCVVALRH